MTRPPNSDTTPKSSVIHWSSRTDALFQPPFWPSTARSGSKPGSHDDAVAVGVAPSPAGTGRSSIASSSIQTAPLPPSPAVIANSIDPTFCSLTVGAVPHASSRRERRMVVVCHVVGHVTFGWRHHQTFRWLGSTSLNSKLFG
jgi:hypothetical protein